MVRGRTVIAVGFVIILMAGSLPATAQNGNDPEIGKYVRLGMHSALTEEDVSHNGDTLTVHAPAFSSTLKVEKEWLDAELKDWSANRAFSMDAQGRVVLPGEDTEFAPLALGTEPTFTLGADDSIRFVGRPMWVSVVPNTEGGITLNMDDGDATGQSIRVSKTWLRTFGIYWPNVTHEDGTVLDFALLENGETFAFEMPHFSNLTINPLDLQVLGKRTGPHVPHTGIRRHYGDENRLEIDVGSELSTYQVWVETGWIDANIPYVGLRGHEWTVQPHNNKQWYVVGLTAAQTPTTLVFEEFSPTTQATFTRGNPASIGLWATNETDRRTAPPVILSVTDDTPPSIVLASPGKYRLLVNQSWLAGVGVGFPNFTSSAGALLVFVNHDNTSFVVETRGNVTIEISNADTSDGVQVLMERRAQTVYLAFNTTSKQAELYNMAYAPWLSYGAHLIIDGVPWEDDVWGQGNVTAVEVWIGDELLETLYPVPGDGETEGIHIIPGTDVEVPPERAFPGLIHEALILIFQDGSGGHPVFSGQVSSPDPGTAGIFRALDQTYCSGWYLEQDGSNKKGQAHKNDHSHSSQAGAYTGGMDDQSGYAGYKRYYYKYCDVNGNIVHSGYFRIEMGVSQKGPTRWYYGGYVTSSIGYQYKGYNDYGNPYWKYAYVTKPGMHMRYADADNQRVADFFDHGPAQRNGGQSSWNPTIRTGAELMVSLLQVPFASLSIAAVQLFEQITARGTASYAADAEGRLGAGVMMKSENAGSSAKAGGMLTRWEVNDLGGFEGGFSQPFQPRVQVAMWFGNTDTYQSGEYDFLWYQWGGPATHHMHARVQDV